MRLGGKPQVFCILKAGVEGLEKTHETYVTLRDGHRIPVVNAAVERPLKFAIDSMPVVQGRKCEKKINYDNCSHIVVVSKNSVPVVSYTNSFDLVFLLNRTLRFLSRVEIFVNTNFFAGKVLVRCTENPLYDLVSGNIPQVREAHQPHPAWKFGQQMSADVRSRRERYNNRQNKKKGETVEKLVVTKAPEYITSNWDVLSIMPLARSVVPLRREKGDG